MNNSISRRGFIRVLGLATASLVFPVKTLAVSKAKVVVVGGGFAGATCAKYLKMWGGNDVEVTLIDKNSSYYSPILSNLILNGQKSLSELMFSYNDLETKYGISFVNKEVSSINSDTKVISFSDTTSLSYDKVVVATGIDFIQSNAYDFEKVPHAWMGGAQVALLKEKLDLIPNNGTFIMSIPKAPYRCPPGPYERACVVADLLSSKNINVTVLDENADIIVEKDTFSTKFNEYGITYISNAKVTNVDDTNNQVTYNSSETLSADLLNIIPNQKASSLVFDMGLDDDKFAPVNFLSYESKLKNDVYVIGDAHKSSMPKAGHIANSEAKICADAILRDLKNELPYQTPVTNSACYSPVSRTEASWLTALYKYDSATQNMIPADSRYPVAGNPSTSNYNEMFNWTGNLFSDTFS
ncbi:MAG TPA: pyridine nucleotide-disulfide oxidoreductase [Arcobacter sp.]|jgi:NADH dehydrogenase FAD-containing subunit|nr:pyridine nucleotide-disulfide oxidoreductase [Arcobacter sp.]